MNHIVTNMGHSTRERLKNLALTEYRKFQVKTLSPVEQAYLESIRMIEKKAKGKKE